MVIGVYISRSFSFSPKKDKLLLFVIYKCDPVYDPVCFCTNCRFCTIDLQVVLRFCCCQIHYDTFNLLTDMGVERGIRLEGMTEAQILKSLEDLVKVGAALKS